MPFRPIFPAVALAAALLVPFGAGHVSPLAWPTEAAGSESCPARSSCPRCPESPRRAPEECRSCARAPLGVAARREEIRLARPEARLSEDPARAEAAGLATPVRTSAARRRSVLGASPPLPLLLATLRN